MDEVTRRLGSSFQQVEQDKSNDLQNVSAKQSIPANVAATEEVSQGIAGGGDSIEVWTADPFADMVAAYQAFESAESIATLFDESKAGISAYLQGLSGQDEASEMFATMMDYLKLVQNEAREDASLSGISKHGAVSELKEHAGQIFSELIQVSDRDQTIQLNERYENLLSWLDDNK